MMAWAAERRTARDRGRDLQPTPSSTPMPLPQYSSAEAIQAAADITPSPHYSALHYLSASSSLSSLLLYLSTASPLPVSPPPLPLPLPLRSTYPLSHLHVLHGLSKDFGLSGYRLGWLVTGSAAVRRAWGNVGYFTSVAPTTCSALIESVLRDEDWVDEYLYRCCEVLARNYHTLSTTARRHTRCRSHNSSQRRAKTTPASPYRT